MELGIRHLLWLGAIFVGIVVATLVIQAPSIGTILIAAVYAIFVGIVVALKWRQDPIATIRGITTIVGLGVIVSFVFARQHGGVYWGLVGLTSIAALAAVYIGWLRRPRGALPNLLFDRARPGDVFETGGVQFCAWVATEPSPGCPGEVALLLQNCVMAPRTVLVEVEDIAAGPLQRSAGLLLPGERTFPLESVEVGQVTVPYEWGGAAPGEVRIYFRLRVTGSRGRRIRYPYGVAPTQRVTPSFQIFALLGGSLEWGGDVALQLVGRPQMSEDFHIPGMSWHRIDADEPSDARGSELIAP